MIKLNILSDNSELIPYNFPDFLIHARIDNLSNYANQYAPLHWHTDLEFIVVLEGEMVYTVDGKDFVLNKDDGIFINSLHIHGHHASNNSDCKFLCVLIPLNFFTAFDLISEKYIKKLCYEKNLSYKLLSADDKYEKDLITALFNIFDLCHQAPLGFELKVISQMYFIMDQLVNATDIEIADSPNNQWIDSIHIMIGYIQTHYMNKITISGISTAGNVCRSKCCQIFKEFTHQSPNDYLTSYRLNKSIELLKSTDLSITDIAFKCGFNSASYFGETFKNEVHCTPKEFRKQNVT